MVITYRKLTAADAKTYREIRLESLRLHPESFGSSYDEQVKLPKLMFENALEQSTDHRFVMGAFDGGNLVGICGFIPLVWEAYNSLKYTGTIIQMYVRETHRGRQIGLGLTRAVLQQAFLIPGIDQVLLEVVETNLSAIRVYEQAGFGYLDPTKYGPIEKKDQTHMMIFKRKNQHAQ